MNKCIDLFYSPSNPELPYIAFVVDDHGVIFDSKLHADIAAAATWCKAQGLPVLTYSSDMCDQLVSYGIDAQTAEPRERAVGE